MARYALVIGIEKYDSPHLNPLSKSVNDAEDIAKLLEEYGDCPKNHIELLTGRVDCEKLIDSFKLFVKEKARNQEAIIYFSGHGVLEIKVANPFTQEVAKNGYLLASNCELSKNGEDYQVEKNGIKLFHIQELIDQTELSSLVFILDACNSGTLIQEIDNSFNIFQNNTTYYFLAACQSYEQSWSKKTNKHSEFTGALLNACSQERANEKGIITVGEAFDRASATLEKSRQQPTFLGKGRALTLVKYPPPLSAYFSVNQSLMISQERIETLENILRKSDLQSLASSAKNFVLQSFSQALIYRPELQSEKALDLDKILRLFQKDFPLQPNRTSSLLAWIEQLIVTSPSGIKEELQDWLQQGQKEGSPSETRGKQQPQTCQAYLVVIVEPQDKIYALRGILYQDEREAQPLLLSVRDDRSADLSEENLASCEFEEIPQTLQKFLDLAQNQHLQGKRYNLTVELLLPLEHLAETVDLWNVCDPLGDPRPLAKDYRIVVRSYERYQHNQFRNEFLLGWQRWQDWKNQPELLKIEEVVEYLEGKCDLDCNGLEANLPNKIALTCTLPPAQCDRESLFKTLIRTGTPLALWSRCCNFDCAREFQQFLTPAMLDNWQNLVEQLYKKRKTAHLAKQPETYWIYHVAAWLDNPDRMPINRLKTIGGS